MNEQLLPISRWGTLKASIFHLQTSVMTTGYKLLEAVDTCLLPSCEISFALHEAHEDYRVQRKGGHGHLG